MYTHVIKRHLYTHNQKTCIHTWSKDMYTHVVKRHVYTRGQKLKSQKTTTKKLTCAQKIEDGQHKPDQV
jgi:hypothetical protein